MNRQLFTAVALTCSLAVMGKGPKGEKIDTLKTYQLQNVQVVGTRASNTTPMAFKNFDKAEIKNVNFGQDIPFILSLTPSVTITSDAGNGIGYTTLRVRGTDPSRINITSNGIPMNDAESAQLFWVNMGDFASSVQSMQIQRGVGTSTNGSGAFGASINMQTENIGMTPYAGIDLSAGSYYSHKETVRFGTGLINDHWGFQGRLSNIGSKGYVDRASTKLNSYFLQGGYFSDNTVVKLITFNGVEQTYHAWDYASKYDQSIYGRKYNPCGEMFTDDQGVTHYYKNQTDNYHQQNYQLVWNQTVNRFWNFNVAAHYTKGRGYYEQYKDGRTLFEYELDKDITWAESDLVRQKKMDNDFYGFVAALNFNNRNNLTATIGGGWSKYDCDHYGLVTWVQNPVDVFYPNHKYYDNNTKKNDGNIYAKLEYQLMEGLNAYVDLQYRHVGVKMNGLADALDWDALKRIVYNLDKSYDFFNPKAGVNFDINENNRVYLSYAISHKEPTRNNYENSLNAFSALPSAERLNDLEVGYRYKSRLFSAGANFYYMDYKDQFVLTGEIDNIGEAVTRNLPKSYRMGIELDAAWKPVDWFRWDINATFAKNKVKDMTVTLNDKSVANLGEQTLAFSPDVIANNIFTFMYKGFKASIMSQYVSDQNLTNTGFETMKCTDENGNTCYETLQLKSHFTTNIDLSYNFSLRKAGIKDATIGISLYNVFSEKYDNNGWAAPQYTRDADNKVIAVNEWGTRDKYATGFAVSAPFNCMAHLSINF